MEKFRKYLLKKKTKNEAIDSYLKKLKGYQDYLEPETIETIDAKKIVDYTELLIEKGDKDILEFLTALLNYAYFIRRNDLIEALIDIFESFNAMDNLYSRIGKWYGEKICDEIFRGLDIPPLGVHPEKKPAFTKKILKRLDEILGEEKTIELLKPCLHRGYGANRNIEQDKKDYQKLGIDAFLEKIKKEQIESFEKNRDKGTPAFA
ncbi:MAG: hypothetical protein U9O98_08330 [Asgard group archaeon]|nr:hypothetical protein [Asgard group archaeon]